MASGITKTDIMSLVPHRGKMLLLSRVLNYDLRERTLCSEYDITGTCQFYDPALDGVPAWVSFEFMAQSISALSGLLARSLGKEPVIGFILSVSSMEIRIPLFLAGSTVRIEVEEELRVDSVFTFQCRVFAGGTEAAHAKLTVLDVEDISVFMEQGSHGNG